MDYEKSRFEKVSVTVAIPQDKFDTLRYWKLLISFMSNEDILCYTFYKYYEECLKERCDREDS